MCVWSMVIFQKIMEIQNNLTIRDAISKCRTLKIIIFIEKMLQYY